MRTVGGLALIGVIAGCASGDVPGSTVGNTFGTFADDGTTGTPDDDGDDGDDGDDVATDSVGTGTAGDLDGPTSLDSSDGAVSESSDGSDGSTGGGCIASPEVCDGVDNDCDEQADEGVASVACNTGMPGACGAGMTVCTSGQEACNQTGQSSAETCDNIDNDCDGTIDDGNPQGGGACATGQPGICSAGTTLCSSGGSLDCVQNQQPGSETCNNLDDDCDSTIDDGNPGGGGGCATGLPGICSGGSFQCQGGFLNCVQSQNAEPEVCGNGIDENCSGSADEGCGCSHDLCVTGEALVNGCDPCVSTVCAADSFCCATSWDGICVGEVADLCGLCVTCEHDVCVAGVAMTSGCSSCVTQICAVDTFCCATSWDGICIGEATSVCGVSCCAHDLCATGVALVNGCDPCVGTVCAADAFCCDNSWDGICVGEVTSLCGIGC